MMRESGLLMNLSLTKRQSFMSFEKISALQLNLNKVASRTIGESAQRIS